MTGVRIVVLLCIFYIVSSQGPFYDIQFYNCVYRSSPKSRLTAATDESKIGRWSCLTRNYFSEFTSVESLIQEGMHYACEYRKCWSSRICTWSDEKPFFCTWDRHGVNLFGVDPDVTIPKLTRRVWLCKLDMPNLGLESSWECGYAASRKRSSSVENDANLEDSRTVDWNLGGRLGYIGPQETTTQVPPELVELPSTPNPDSPPGLHETPLKEVKVNGKDEGAKNNEDEGPQESTTQVPPELPSTPSPDSPPGVHESPLKEVKVNGKEEGAKNKDDNSRIYIFYKTANMLTFLAVMILLGPIKIIARNRRPLELQNSNKTQTPLLEGRTDKEPSTQVEETTV